MNVSDKNGEDTFITLVSGWLFLPRPLLTSQRTRQAFMLGMCVNEKKYKKTLKQG